MILVDTSVLVDAWRRHENQKTELFRRLIAMDCEFGFSIYTCQEALQGARDESELNRIREFFSAYPIFYLDRSFEIFDSAAYIYYTLRREGKTLRGAIDALIAVTAITNQAPLLHNDRDFDVIAERFPALHILSDC
ncbi:twitching motility protein PilT [Clostridia bacterium]|nr:twitching motility protein PilT [Clostridia bacterium]